MKRIIAALFLVAAITVLAPSSVLAATGLTGPNPTVPKGQTINDDVYAGGQTVTVNGRINGNLTAGGGNVTVNGVVTGTVISGGGNVVINGSVNNSVMAAGGAIVIRGTVGHDVSFAGGSLTIEHGATVGRDVNVAGGTATINGRVNRNVETRGGATRVGPRAYIGGHIGYVGNTAPTVAPGAVVRGPIIHRSGSAAFSGNPFSAQYLPWSTGIGLVAWLRNFVGLLVFGLLAVLLFPAFTRRVTDQLYQHVASSFGWGALTLVGVPILALVTLIAGLFIGGWWLSLMELGLYWLGLTLGLTYASVFLGRRIIKLFTPQPPYMAACLAAGLVTLLAVSVIPVLGGVTLFIATIWGLGGLVAVVYNSLAHRPDESAAVPPVTTSPSQAAM